MDVYCKSLFCYTDNINRKSGYQRDKQRKMNRSQLDECQKEKKDVISIIYYLYDLVFRKIFYIWLKSILGNHEITLHSYFLSHDIDRDGSMRVNIYSLSAVDHWWDYRTFNFTYIKRAAMNQKWSIAARRLWIILTFLFLH